MRIAILYDSFAEKGGAEITISILAEHLRADIITAGWDRRLFPPSNAYRIVDLENWTIRHKNPLGLLEAGLRHFIRSKKLKYDLYILTGFYAIFAAFRASPSIYYCLSPNRSIYDLHDFRLAHYSGLERLAFVSITKSLRIIDQKAIRRMKRVVTQSKTVQQRVKKVYGRESVVIYPPVETDRFYFEDFGDYYLAISRLSPPKRIPMIIKAFKRMPDQQLVIAGDGENREQIIKATRDTPNIHYVGPVTGDKKQQLYARCLATIFMGKNEDFGLIPIEGNAAGKACIAANEGGCRETVVPGKSGFLVKAAPTAIIRAVRDFDESQAKDMKNFCIVWAKRFSTINSVKHWKTYIAKINTPKNKTLFT